MFQNHGGATKALVATGYACRYLPNPQVGLPKVTCCAEHFRSISDKVTVDARDAMFTAGAADTLLLRNEVGEVEEPKLVVD